MTFSSGPISFNPIVVGSGGGSSGIPLPADRLAVVNWQNAGLQSKGGPSGAGIPTRNTISSTLSPKGNGGGNITLTIANPGVITWPGTVPANGTAFCFQSTGHLPFDATNNTYIIPGAIYFVTNSLTDG